MGSSSDLASRVYIRKATGMVRGYSLLDMFVMNMNGLAPTAMISTMFAVVVASYPGADIVWALLVSTPFVICFALAYGTLASVMPRSGGDYVFGSRVLHPVIGLMGGFVYFVVHFVADAWIPIYTATYLLPITLTLTFPGSDSVHALIVSLQEPTVIAIFGTILLTASCLIAIFGKTIWRLFNYTFCFFGIAGGIVAIIILSFQSPAGFVAAFNHFAASYGTSYQGITNLAIAQGWSPARFSIFGSFAAITYMYLYIFTAWPVYMGSEVKSGEKALPASIVGSIIVAQVIAIVTAVLYYRVIPSDWQSAISYLAYNKTSAYPLPFNPEIFGMVNILFSNPITTFLVGFGVTLFNLSWLFNDNVISSRVMFSWSFDRLLPQKFASIHPKWKTPAFCLILFEIGVEITMFAWLYQGSILGVMMNNAVMIAIAFLPAQIACAVVAYRTPDMWHQSPAWCQKRFAGIPLPTIYGTISSVFEAAMIVMFIWIFPTFGGPVNPFSMTIVAFFVLITIPWYYTAKWYHMKKEGIDIAWAFKTMPPA